MRNTHYSGSPSKMGDGASAIGANWNLFFLDNQRYFI
jgi:hypothetical protein